MYTIDLTQELEHNKDLRQILQVQNSISLKHQEQLQADLNASLIRQMSEDDTGDWHPEYAVKIRRLRERTYAIGVSHALIHVAGTMRARMVDRRYFVSGLVDARVDELEARIRERQCDSYSPNVFGNAPLYVVGK